MQALDVADPSAKQADTSESFLSASFTPSLTYAEFSLMCGHLLTSAAARPQVHLLRAINTIFVFCHVYWARAVTFRYSCGLYSKMVEYLCLDDLTASTINSQSLVVKSGNFKLSWVNKGIDLDAAMEDIAIPARCSRDLVEYLTTLNTQVMHCFLSIDSVQKAYDVTVNNYNSSEVDEITDASFGDSSREVVDEACVKSTSLCFFVNKVFWHLAMSEIFVVYAELLVLARQPNMGSLKGEIIEEATLQAIFDLSVCDTIANFTLSMTDNSKSVPQINSTSVTCFKHLIEDWQMLMDPITAELVLPYLKMTSKQFMKSMQLLVAEIPVRMEVDEAQSIKQSKLDGIFASNAETTITKAHFALLPLSFSATGSTSMQQNLVDEFINSPTATDSSIDGTLPRKSASVSVTPSSSHGSFMSSFGFLRK